MSCPETDLSRELANDLLEMTTWSKDPEIARLARIELWSQFKPYVYVAAKDAYGVILGAEQIYDLVVDTFIRAFERAHTFKNEKLDDEERARRWVGVWLCSIMRNLASDQRQARGRSQIDQMSILDPEHLERVITLRKPAVRLGPLAQRVASALATPGVLNPKQIVVLREWAEHYNIERDQQRLPAGVTEKLAVQLSVQPESIRQILGRGLKRLRTSLEGTDGLDGARP